MLFSVAYTPRTHNGLCRRRGKSKRNFDEVLVEIQINSVGSVSWQRFECKIDQKASKKKRSFFIRFVQISLFYVNVGTCITPRTLYIRTPYPVYNGNGSNTRPIFNASTKSAVRFFSDIGVNICECIFCDEHVRLLLLTLEKLIETRHVFFLETTQHYSSYGRCNT